MTCRGIAGAVTAPDLPSRIPRTGRHPGLQERRMGKGEAKLVLVSIVVTVAAILVSLIQIAVSLAAF